MKRQRIFCLGKIVEGEIRWTIVPLPVKEREPVDAELQRLIDEGEATEDYENYLIDVEYMRSWH